MNTWIREAAGRASAPAPALGERPAGRAIHRVERAGFRAPLPRGRRGDVNDLIRHGALIARTATVAGGVSLGDVDFSPYRR
jgi:hypothetical protein